MAGETGSAPAEGYFDEPILNILVPQRGQVPWVAGRPFFILMFFGLDISLLALHFMQYACIVSSPLTEQSLAEPDSRARISNAKKR